MTKTSTCKIMKTLRIGWKYGKKPIYDNLKQSIIEIKTRSLLYKMAIGTPFTVHVTNSSH